MIASRLAMILTALRKAEAEWSIHDLTCSDKDFILALAIIEVLASHSLLFATSLHKQKLATVELRKYFRVRQALEKLISVFTYTELIDVFVSVCFAESTVKCYRLRLMKMGIIVKEGGTTVLLTANGVPNWKNRRWVRCRKFTVNPEPDSP